MSENEYWYYYVVSFTGFDEGGVVVKTIISAENMDTY
jgi:hypothetical protein